MGTVLAGFAAVPDNARLRVPLLRLYRLRPAALLAALAGVLAAMVAACFWPFAFNPRNEVAWLKGESGLRFSGQGQALSRGDFRSLARSPGDGALTVEIALRPLRIDRRGAPYILSFLSEAGLPDLIVGSWTNFLQVYIGKDGAGEGAKKYSRLSLRDVLAPGRTSFVTVTAGRGGTAISVDGRLRRDSADDPLPAGAYPPGRLLLGNSPTGKRGWEGDILAVAVYGRALTPEEVSANHKAWVSGGLPQAAAAEEALIVRYTFDEGSGAVSHGRGALPSDIVVPPVFKPLRRSVLVLPPKETKIAQLFSLDGILNVFGFVPFGFLAALAIGLTPRLSERWQSTIVVLAGFAVSLAIELTQVFIPARTSTLSDLCANTIGAAVGVFLCFALRPDRVDCAAAARGVPRNSG